LNSFGSITDERFPVHVFGQLVFGRKEARRVVTAVPVKNAK
jgi:hypothetical protein